MESRQSALVTSQRIDNVLARLVVKIEGIASAPITCHSPAYRIVDGPSGLRLSCCPLGLTSCPNSPQTILWKHHQ